MNALTPYTRPEVVRQALALLECEVREVDVLATPGAVRDYLRLRLGDRPHEVFAVAPRPRHPGQLSQAFH